MSTLELSPNMQAMRDSYLNKITSIIDSMFQTRQAVDNVPITKLVMTPESLLTPDVSTLSEKDALAELAAVHKAADLSAFDYRDLLGDAKLVSYDDQVAKLDQVISSLGDSLHRSATRSVANRRKAIQEQELKSVKGLYKASESSEKIIPAILAAASKIAATKPPRPSDVRPEDLAAILNRN